MKNAVLFLLLSGFLIPASLRAQKVIPSPKPKPTDELSIKKAQPVTKEEIKVNPPVVVNMQQLSDEQAANPPKHKKKRFIEQGEDWREKREEKFKRQPRQVPPGTPVFDFPQNNQQQHQQNSPAPIGTWNGVMETQPLIPPDIRGAAGPTYVMETTNQDFRIYTKTGTLTSTVDIDNFFNATGGGGYFDPHIVYDNINNRFIVCIDGNLNGGNGNSGLFIAVSQTSNPTGSWYVYSFDAVGNGNDFLDFPLLGYNTNWVVITGNDFLGSGGTSVKIYVMNRATLYAGTLGTVSSFTDGNAFTIAPAQTFDAAQTAEYLVQEYTGNQGGNGYVQIGKITGAVNSPAYTAGSTVGVNQPWSENNVGASQSGNSNIIEDGDTRIGNAVYINGSLWFCNTVFLPASNPSYDGVDWWQVNPATMTVQQFGRVATSGKFYYYPSIAVNQNGDALLGYSESSSGMFASAAYSFHAHTDANNTMQSDYVYKSGVAGYYKTLGGSRNRWGDYTGTAVDPSDNSFWGFGEWANTSNNWGTQVVHVPVTNGPCFAGASFTNSTDTSCSAPFTVDFTNNSTNSTTYTWYFGDGTSSTAANPSHTYAAAGTYSVKLVVSSTSCGTDSITKANLVNIGSQFPCSVIMPATGTATTQTSCTGVVYDDGGPSANYTDNTNSTITISPTGAANVTLHFTQFGMENTYDFLYVYDGPTTASTQIGAYTGTTLPADITSTGPSITIRQSTDPAVEDVGFAVHWGCISASAPPVANLQANATSSCTGTIQFTDLSTGGPTTWLWNFGDGATATVRNPLHTYNMNGTFTVTLTATNAFGNNTITKINYITISRPVAPTVGDASSCGPKSFTLTAAAGGNPVTWFNNLGAVVSTSNPFVTPLLSSNTSYTVIDTVPASILHVGPASATSLGAGGYYSNSTDRYLNFDVISSCTLKTVLVNAGSTGSRVIALRNAAGTVLQSSTVNLAAGYNTVTLNFALSPGTNYQLGINGTADLYRNNAATSGYPFTLAGLVSITGSNAGAAYYYYFYDWVVQGPPCISLPASTSLTINPAVSTSVTSVDVACNGGNTGSATAVASAGTPQYTYHWSNNQSTSVASGLTAGTYTVTVSDVVGCSATGSKTITEPTALTTTINATNVSCNGGNNGAVSLSVSGGTSAYSYNWGGGSTSQNQNNLIAGTYNVTVTDAHSCTATASTSVTQPTALSITTSANSAACGLSNGSAQVNVTGGTALYSYLWNNSATTASISNLSAGTYTVTVTDNHGCSSTAAAAVTSTGALSATPSAVDALCFGTATGSASVTASSGTQPYTYHWNTGASVSSISNVPAGTYTVTITDAAGCLTTASQTISEPVAINISVTVSDAGCGTPTGGATASVSGGSPNYTYTWSNGGSTAAISGLAAGTYTLTLSDSHACSATAAAVVNGAGNLAVNSSSTNATCFGSATGSAGVEVTAGTQPITYLWNNGVNASSIANVVAGTYTVTISDAAGCVTTVSETVSEPAAITVFVSVDEPSCHGANDGSATVSATGGTVDYSFSWSTGVSDTAITNILSGNYSVTVSDANNCTSVSGFAVSEPDVLAATTTPTPVMCYGDQNGAALATPTGGAGPYTYLWCNSNNTQGAVNLPVGNCSVTVTDSHGCTTTAAVNITGPAQIQFATSTTNAGIGQSNGSITVANLGGGTSPYTFNWSNGSTTQNLVNVAGGTYSVTVTDVNGCTAGAMVIVQENPSGVVAVNGDIAFNVSPNPAKDELLITIDRFAENMSMSIKDPLGQVIMNKLITSSLTKVDLSLVARGVYFIEIKQGNKKSVKEVVVSK